MKIEILSAVRPAYVNNLPVSPNWPAQVPVTTTGWVKPGNDVCVTLLTLSGAQDRVELPWGCIDPATEELDFAVWSEGKNFARKCLVQVAEVRQGCDAEGAVGTVSYRPKHGGMFAAIWVPAKPHLHQPVAFKLLTAPAGHDLAPYCSRQPIVIPPEGCANWLNPSVVTVGLQHAPPVGTFEMLEADGFALVSA